MGLSAGMWSGVSGLTAHGNKMNMIGNNIANVNTIGFKGARMDFEDFLSQDISTANSTGQLGRGVGVGAIYGDFSQGAFQNTNETTDLAISGNGFFAVKPQGSESTYYTRAGNFRFDENGYLVDPHGYVLQGKVIETDDVNPLPSGGSQNTGGIQTTKGVGSPVDIELGNFILDPKHTRSATFVTKLNMPSGSADNAKPATGQNKNFALFQNAWDGSNPTEPIGENSFAYQSTMVVYDEGGAPHDMTVYFDQISAASGGKSYWEYMVTIDPNDDNRFAFDSAGNRVDIGGTSAAGIMMMGTIQFNSSGQMEDMTAFTLAASNCNTGNLRDLNNWKATAVDKDGYPMFDPNFSGHSNAGYVVRSNGYVQSPLPDETRPISINLGLKCNTLDWNWNNAANTPAGDAERAAYSAASILDSDPSSFTGFGTLNAEREPFSTKVIATDGIAGGSTVYQTQDGYTYGYLQNVAIDADGVLSGRYSNGVLKEMYEIQLYDFMNKWGLRREGGNLFSQTNESGIARYDAPGEIGLGSIASNSLETSNVDMATEFVNMIITEKGFQANSKVITTSDQMMSTVIMMKR